MASKPATKSSDRNYERRVNRNRAEDTMKNQGHALVGTEVNAATAKSLVADGKAVYIEVNGAKAIRPATNEESVAAALASLRKMAKKYGR